MSYLTSPSTHLPMQPTLSWMCPWKSYWGCGERCRKGCSPGPRCCGSARSSARFSWNLSSPSWWQGLRLCSMRVIHSDNSCINRSDNGQSIWFRRCHPQVCWWLLSCRRPWRGFKADPGDLSKDWPNQSAPFAPWAARLLSLPCCFSAALQKIEIPLWICMS